MVNVCLLVEYNGRNFCGWQAQPNARTVQGELEKAIKTILRSSISALHSAGRTDSGVHARGQVVTFKVEELPDLKRLALGVSHLLRGDLAVLEAKIVSDDFHPLRSVECKQYSYTILSRSAPPVLDLGKVWHIPNLPNIEMMKRGAKVLVGKHDFSSFRAGDCTAKTSVKEILESEVIIDEDYVIYRVVGKGFLKQMVRNIVGTLVDMAKGKLPGLTIEDLLDKRDRTQAGVTAPAWGLCFDWVRYRSE